MRIVSPIQVVQIQSFGVQASGTFSTFTMSGVKAGDILLGVSHITTGKFEPVGYNATSKFIPIVATDDVMQQNGGDDYSDNEFIFSFLRLNQES